VLHNLYPSQHVIGTVKSSRKRWAELTEFIVDMRCAFNISVGKPEGMRPFRRIRCRLEDNIKMDLKQHVCGQDSSGLW